MKRSAWPPPGNAETHYDLGVALEENHDLNGAIEEYELALILKPDDAATRKNLGFVFAQKGDLERAITEYNGALRIKPDYAKARYNLGVALEKNGDLETALEQYRMAYELGPDSALSQPTWGSAPALQGAGLRPGPASSGIPLDQRRDFAPTPTACSLFCFACWK